MSRPSGGRRIEPRRSHKPGHDRSGLWMRRGYTMSREALTGVACLLRVLRAPVPPWLAVASVSS